MNTKIVLFVISLLPAIYGCTMNGGDVAKEDLSKIMTCKDTRDNGTFQFNTNTIRNHRAGFGAPSSFDITTLDGHDMTLSSEMESWLKCENRVEDKH